MSLLIPFLDAVGSDITTPESVVLLGDSTITSQACRTETIAEILFTPTEQSQGWSAHNLAVGGHTINDQLAVWNAYANKTDHDIIIIQVGLNNMGANISDTLSQYQNLVNTVNSTKKAGAKVFISCMLPCKQRWVDLGMMPGAQSNWVALNNAIMTTITGVNKRNDYHVSLLDDGSGNLAAAYDCGDHIHENLAGAEIIRDGFRLMIF